MSWLMKLRAPKKKDAEDRRSAAGIKDIAPRQRRRLVLTHAPLSQEFSQARARSAVILDTTTVA